MDTFIERKVNKWTQEALSDTKNSVYWSDKPEAPDPSPKLDGQISADLVIVGAGYTGLWAAFCFASHRRSTREKNNCIGSRRCRSWRLF